ncbi:hypothetical protein VNI00_017625 [Paramarasmius palmivorus]|uniref:Uncharacterized protein n=1 Tax=Paramarasmius palmivorus TaxID=297713 RepID=A0AAW0B5K9_9AGAR
MANTESPPGSPFVTSQRFSSPLEDQDSNADRERFTDETLYAIYSLPEESCIREESAERAVPEPLIGASSDSAMTDKALTSILDTYLDIRIGNPEDSRFSFLTRPDESNILFHLKRLEVFKEITRLLEQTRDTELSIKVELLEAQIEMEKLRLEAMDARRRLRDETGRKIQIARAQAELRKRIDKAATYKLM